MLCLAPPHPPPPPPPPPPSPPPHQQQHHHPSPQRVAQQRRRRAAGEPGRTAGLGARDGRVRDGGARDARGRRLTPEMAARRRAPHGVLRTRPALSLSYGSHLASTALLTVCTCVLVQVRAECHATKTVLAPGGGPFIDLKMVRPRSCAHCLVGGSSYKLSETSRVVVWAKLNFYRGWVWAPGHKVKLLGGGSRHELNF
jgi:hypothetical protein